MKLVQFRPLARLTEKSFREAYRRKPEIILRRTRSAVPCSCPLRAQASQQRRSKFMDRPFALIAKCYGGFVLVADRAPNAPQTRLWPINTECAAVGHGSVPTVFEVGHAVLGPVPGDEPIEVVFPRLSDALTQHCNQNGVAGSIGFIFAGFDAERRQRLFGWVRQANALTTQSFDQAIVHSFPNPIGNHLTTKLYSFDLEDEMITRIGLYTLMETRTILPYPMDEFAEVGWLRSSYGLEIKSDEYIRERLNALHRKGEELRIRCQELLAKEHT